MAQTIGTNIVVDGSEQYELIQRLADALAKGIENANKDKYAEMIKLLGGYVQNGGQLQYKLAPKKFTNEIEKKLDQANIPYMKIFDNEGNVAFCMRQEDNEKFLEIQKQVFSLSTDYSFTLPEYDLAQNCQQMQTKLVKLTFPNEEMALISKQKIYQSGVVSAKATKENDKDSKEVSLYIDPKAIFQATGEDLASIEIKYALEESMNSPTINDRLGIFGQGVSMLEVRKEQATYDKKRISEVVDAVMGTTKDGKAASPVVLFDEALSSNLYITAERGKLTICEKDADGKWGSPKTIELPTEELMDKKRVKPNDRQDYMLDFIESKVTLYADDIYNMTTADLTDGLRAIKGDIEVKDVPHEERPTFNSMYEKKSKNRNPELIKRTAERAKIIKRVSNREMTYLLNAVTMEASQQVSATMNKFTIAGDPLTAYREKKRIMVNMLRDETNPHVQKFLQTEVKDEAGNVILSEEDLRAWLAELVEDFDRDDEENTIGVSFEDPEKVLGKEKYKDREAEKSKTPDRAADKGKEGPEM